MLVIPVLVLRRQPTIRAEQGDQMVFPVERAVELLPEPPGHGPRSGQRRAVLVSAPVGTRAPESSHHGNCFEAWMSRVRGTDSNVQRHPDASA